MALGVRQVLVAGLTAGGVLALSRLMSPSEFAYYGWTIAVVTAVTAVGDLGFGGALIRSARARQQAGAAVTLHRRRLLPIAALFAVAIALAPLSAGVQQAAFLLLACALFLSPQMVLTAVLEAEGRFALIGAIEVVQRAVLIGVAVALAAVIHAPWIAPAAGAVSALVGYLLTLGASGVPFRAAGSSERLDTHFSAAWLQGRVANQLNYGVYPLLGALFFSSHDLGLILWALSVSALPGLAGQLTARVLFPAAAIREGRRTAAAHLEVVTTLVAMATPAVAAMIVFARPLTHLIFGAKWLGAVTVLQLECVNTLLGLILTPTAPILYLLCGARRAKSLMLIFTLQTWVLGAALVAPLGITALSTGTLISASVTTVLCHVALKRAGYPGLTGLWRAVCIFIVACAVGLAWGPDVSSIPALLAALAAFGAAVLAAIVWTRAAGDLRGLGRSFRLALRPFAGQRSQ